ncbi:hypothetical protein [Allosediminivita pacifica]|uniref:hypothetical protein n=1 Tax=Allosediminivita pacifica TaxID=1267769 RepID=UPI000D397826|nr:hypothetical protein [Allosediminivita pacifica]
MAGAGPEQVGVNGEALAEGQMHFQAPLALPMPRGAECSEEKKAVVEGGPCPIKATNSAVFGNMLSRTLRILVSSGRTERRNLPECLDRGASPFKRGPGNQQLNSAPLRQSPDPLTPTNRAELHLEVVEQRRLDRSSAEIMGDHLPRRAKRAVALERGHFQRSVLLGRYE